MKKLYFHSIKRTQKAANVPTYELVKVPIVDENGDEVIKVEKRELDCAKVNEGLTADDFSIRNILATGATDLLKENRVIPSSPLRVAAQVENFETQTM